MKQLLLLVVVFNFAGLTSAELLAPIPIVPDSKMTPGAHCSPSDRDFETYRYEERMPYCHRRVKSNLKRQIYEMYGIPSKCHRSYTIDHFIPLSMGGNNSIHNLWPEHHLVKATRESLEEDLFRQIEIGAMTSAEAVEELVKAKTQLQLDLSDRDGCG